MDSKELAPRPIHGISLASFLQTLELERKSITLIVSHGDEEGRFYLHEGRLVDADYNNKVGLAAAYSLLVWEYASCRVVKGEDRTHRIKEPLTRILMNLAAKKDETEEITETGDRKMAKDQIAGSLQENPVLVRLVDELIAMPGVKHYCLLGNQGKMIASSWKSQKNSDFIAYSIISGMQIRKALNVKALHRVRIKLKDEGMLLIVPSGGMIIGLLLDESVSESEVHTRLRQAARNK